MTVQTFAPSLAGLCAYPKHNESFAGGPWRSGDWVFATNGYLIIGHRSAELVEAVAPRNLAVTAAPKFLDPEPQETLGVGFAAIKRAAGKVFIPTTVPCSKCDGLGRDDDFTSPCEHCGQPTRSLCDRCDGSGRLDAVMPERGVRILGVPVNWVFLAYALEVVAPVRRCTVGRLKVDGGNVLIIDAGEWRIGLMQVNDLFAHAFPTWPTAAHIEEGAAHD